MPQLTRSLNTQMESYDGDLRGHRNSVRSAAFSPDGSLVAAGGHIDGTIRLWDTTSGRELANLPAGTELEGAKEPPTVTDVVFSPDGATLVTNAIAEDGLRLWDVDIRQIKKIHTFEGAIRPGWHSVQTAGGWLSAAPLERSVWHRFILRFSIQLRRHDGGRRRHPATQHRSTESV